MSAPIQRALRVGAILTTVPVALDAQGNGLDLAAEISVVVLAVVSLLVLAAVTMVLLQVRKLVSALTHQLAPVMDRARGTAENVEFVSAVVRRDIEKVNESVTAVTARLKDASNHMEDRIEEFNALMGVVQGEAEDILLDTAAAVRGVQTSARTLSEGATLAGPAPSDSPPDNPPMSESPVDGSPVSPPLHEDPPHEETPTVAEPE